VRPENGSVALESLIPGLNLGLMAIIWIGILVMLVARFHAAVVSNDTTLKVANRLVAVTFFGLACRLVERCRVQLRPFITATSGQREARATRSRPLDSRYKPRGSSAARPVHASPLRAQGDSGEGALAALQPSHGFHP